MSFDLDSYVDVAQRIQDFYAQYPEGRLCMGSEPRIAQIGDKFFVWYHARAFRTPEDPLPGDGWAAEPVPGPTQFTRDSELMNAETAAWGRAIVALGFATKKIASKQEVQARGADRQVPVMPRDERPPEPLDPNAPMSPEKQAEVEAYAGAAGFDFWKVADEVLGLAAHERVTNGQAKGVCAEIARRKKAA